MTKAKIPTTEEMAGMLKASGLKEKLIFTFLMIIVFRFGTQIPVFGINSEIFKNLAAIFEKTFIIVLKLRKRLNMSSI